MTRVLHRQIDPARLQSLTRDAGAGVALHAPRHVTPAPTPLRGAVEFIAAIGLVTLVLGVVAWGLA